MLQLGLSKKVTARNVPRRVNGILHTGQAEADFMDFTIHELKVKLGPISVIIKENVKEEAGIEKKVERESIYLQK